MSKDWGLSLVIFYAIHFSHFSHFMQSIWCLRAVWDQQLVSEPKGIHFSIKNIRFVEDQEAVHQNRR